MIIEKGIPIPESTSRKPGLTQDLRQMEVGDSGVVDMTGRDKKYRNVIYSTAKALGYGVTLRSTPEGNLRVWRTR
jgi:hypothetical protein